MIGGSAGGARVVGKILEALPAGFDTPLVVVLHIARQGGQYLPVTLSTHTDLRVAPAEDKERVDPGCVHLAVPDYHLLVELDRSLSLSQDERVRFSRPSIDVLFESAAEAYGEALVGVLLTGANEDGSRGLHTIHEFGGRTIVEDPDTAEVRTMPEAALALFDPDHVLPATQIGATLHQLCGPHRGDR